LRMILETRSTSSATPWKKGWLICLQRIYNVWCSMLVFTPFA
jgi:hypothetical protein